MPPSVCMCVCVCEVDVLCVNPPGECSRDCSPKIRLRSLAQAIFQRLLEHYAKFVVRQVLVAYSGEAANQLRVMVLFGLPSAQSSLAIHGRMSAATDLGQADSHQLPLGQAHGGAPLVGAEIWDGDERRKIQSSKSCGSPNGSDLFTELAFL